MTPTSFKYLKINSEANKNYKLIITQLVTQLGKYSFRAQVFLKIKYNEITKQLH